MAYPMSSIVHFADCPHHAFVLSSCLPDAGPPLTLLLAFRANTVLVGLRSQRLPHLASTPPSNVILHDTRPGWPKHLASLQLGLGSQGSLACSVVAPGTALIVTT